MLTETLYQSIYRIRRVEEEIARIYPSDKIMSPVHLSIGQEAISVGICAALEPQDVVFGSYRSHAMYLAKGGSLPAMLAELYGKATGCAKGKAGSMHLLDPDAGVMGASAVVSTTLPHAVGYALALRTKKENGVVVCFFGDGATEEGVFHESLNFAALHKLPVLFVCENNRYAIHIAQQQRQAQPDVCAVPAAHGIPSVRFSDMDVFQIYQQTCAAVESMRLGDSGPVFFECPCYRWREHVGPGFDFTAGYRDSEEAQPWQLMDQLRLVGDRIPASRRQELEICVEEEICQAILFAEQSPFPEPSELYTDLF